MCSEVKIILILAAVLGLGSCVTGRRIATVEKAGKGVGINMVAQEEPPLIRDSSRGPNVDSLTVKSGGPLIMNAIRDTETGEMVATDIIVASKVTARFRNVAERLGRVEIMFDITVPGDLVKSDLRLKFIPFMSLFCRRDNGDTERTDSALLDPVYITGSAYRQRQLKGYERYEAFLSTIITDTTEFIRRNQLEQFLRRYFPETYAMKTDSTEIWDQDAENLFGVDVRTAVEHYTNHILKTRNQKRILNKDKMFRKFVRDPIFDGNIRIDTVLESSDGNLVYRYAQTVSARPGLRKIQIDMAGSVFRDGRQICDIPPIDSLVFYVSSLSSMADDEPRYIFKVLERRVTDHTNAYIDFEQGSSVFDTLAQGNAAELRRIKRSFSDVRSNDDLVLDSVVVTASCSPEGDYDFNSSLAHKRSLSVMNYVSEMSGNALEDFPEGCFKSSYVPENWDYFQVLVKNDTVLDEAARVAILRVASEDDKEAAEQELSRMSEYKYLREKVYPKLRTVRFDFHLHRKNMVKDTVHTTELDTLYMNGVACLKASDYKGAAARLKSYGDFNSALAMASSGYDEAALIILRRLDPEVAKVSYLTSLVLSRMGRYKEAAAYFEKSVAANPAMRHRANLDPEMTPVINYGKNNGQ